MCDYASTQPLPPTRHVAKNVCMYLRYKLLLLKIAIAFSVVWLNSTCFILLYGGDVFVFHMLASQIAISHKENTHMGRLYIFVLGGYPPPFVFIKTLFHV